MKVDEIINKAHELFSNYGIKSISMDEVARDLGISKKTLYEHVKDKNDLVKRVTSLHLDKEKSDFLEVKKTAINALDQMVKFSNCMRRNLRSINPTLLFDLKKYHHDAWEKWSDFKASFIHKEVVENMKRGIEEGLFRSDLNVKLLALMRLHQVEIAFDNNYFPRKEFDFREVQIELLNHFVYGITTNEGRKLFEKYLDELKSVKQ